MKRTKDKDGVEWIVSRIRNNQVELVHSVTGHLVKVNASSLPATYTVQLRLLNVASFIERPRSFLTQLRGLRDGYVTEKIRKNRAAAERRRAKAEGRATTPRKPRKPSTRVLKKTDALLANQTPEMQAAILALLKGP